MKNSLFTLLVMLITLKTSVWAQESKTSEKYGNTLNLGGGIGYFGYVGHALPVGMLNYEFDVAKSNNIEAFI